MPVLKCFSQSIYLRSPASNKQYCYNLSGATRDESDVFRNRKEVINSVICVVGYFEDIKRRFLVIRDFITKCFQKPSDPATYATCHMRLKKKDDERMANVNVAF